MAAQCGPPATVTLVAVDAEIRPEVGDAGALSLPVAPSRSDVQARAVTDVIRLWPGYGHQLKGKISAHLLNGIGANPSL